MPKKSTVVSNVNELSDIICQVLQQEEDWTDFIKLDYIDYWDEIELMLGKSSYDFHIILRLKCDFEVLVPSIESGESKNHPIYSMTEILKMKPTILPELKNGKKIQMKIYNYVCNHSNIDNNNIYNHLKYPNFVCKWVDKCDRNLGYGNFVNVLNIEDVDYEL